MPVAILRALSFVPAALNAIHNLKEGWKVPLRDAGGPLLIQTTQTEYYVAVFWVMLAFANNLFILLKRRSNHESIVHIGGLLELDLDYEHDEALVISLRD